jgi:hypothetical protein
LSSKDIKVPADKLAAEAHLAGQFLIAGQIQNKGKSEVPSRDTKTSNFQKRRTEFRTKVNLNKEKCIEVIPPLTRLCTPNHPTRRLLPTPPSQISMKFGIQHYGKI